MLKRFRVTQQFVPERDFELMASYAEVMEFAANSDDVTFPFSAFVCRRETRHDAIGGYDFQNVQVFNRGGSRGQNGFFVDPSAADSGVGRPERNKVRVKVVVYVRPSVAANRRQGYRGLGLNQASARMTEFSAKGVTFGVKVKGNALPRSHGGHLRC